MLRRRGEVYRTILGMAPQRSTQDHPLSTTATSSAAARHVFSSISCGFTSNISPSHRHPTRVKSPSSQCYRQHTQQQPPSVQHRSALHNHHHRFHRSSPIDQGHIATRHHHSRLLSSRRSQHSSYDPELAAYMDRWTRIIFSGQRRMQSSLAKRLPNTTASTYSTVDVSRASMTTQGPVISQHEQRSSSTKPSTTSDDIPAHSSVLSAMEISEFSASMSRIPVGDHELPPLFRSLKKIKGNRKPMLPIEHRNAIETIWSEYMYLSMKTNMDDDLLSRQDYARLLQILRQSHNSSLAATRILRLYMDLQAVGVNLTRKMYEVVLQAHIMVGALPESIRLYQDVTDMVGQGTLEHKKVLWTVVDAFGANQMIPDGIAFLDQLPIFSSEDGSATSFVHSLYRRLFLCQFKSMLHPGTTAQRAIVQFAARPKPPRLTDVSRVMEVFARYPEEDSVLVFSRMVTGLLVKTQDVETLTPLLQRLLLSSHFGEAARVLDMTLAHGMEPRLDQIRLHLLQSAHAFTDKAHHEHAIDQWDTITIQRSRSQDTSPLDPSQSLAEQQAPHSILVAEYSNLLRWRIYEGDLTGAQSAAIHISARGWTPQGIDFHQLCSYMVNHSRSSHYPDYLEVLYTLGGSLVPDLHTYRRLVYAACRRSDLQSALTLFKLVQTRHPDWQLDSTIYNAIISTAAAAGHIRVAEKTLACMLKDGVKPDHFSFHGLLNGYGNAGDLEAAAMIPEHMLKQKLIPTTRTFNLVMKAYLGSRMDLTTTRKLLRVMQSSGQMVPPDLVTFNQLLEGYRRVGNTEWFDAYFDRYFRDKQTPSVSDSACCEEENIVGEGDPDVMQSQDTIAKDGITQSIDNDCKQSMKTVVRPVKSDDWTLFIQLKHSLELRNVDLPTVKELWHAVKPKVVPSTARPLIPQDSVDVNNTDNDKAAPIQPLSSPSRSDDSVLSSTHVPFQKRLDSVWMPATDHEYFRFTTLTLFRAAFRSRGDTTGVKTMDDIISQLFPEHPSSLIFLKRRAMKKFRALTKKTKGKNGSKHSGPSSK